MFNFFWPEIQDREDAESVYTRGLGASLIILAACTINLTSLLMHINDPLGPPEGLSIKIFTTLLLAGFTVAVSYFLYSHKSVIAALMLLVLSISSIGFIPVLSYFFGLLAIFLSLASVRAMLKLRD